MSKSATRDRTATSQRIFVCAQVLTDERGLDGFTMDDLAEAAEVSRRTLFNYYPGKVDAVLGEWPDFEPQAVEAFRAGGPEGDLVADLRFLAMPLVESRFTDRELLVRSHRILLANPRLITHVHQRYEELSATVVEHVVAREGAAFGQDRAKVAVTLLAALFEAAFDGYLHDPRSRSFAHHFDQSLLTARSLLGA